MVLDPSRSPRLAAYLKKLPDGITSYPAAATKADFSLILRPKLAEFLGEAHLSPALRAALAGPWQAGEWIPTAVYVALCELARDRLWPSDEAYHEGMFAVATQMYEGPIYRTLFAMFGPSLVAMNAAKRWHTLHRGTDLCVQKQTKESVALRLTYPPHLFSLTAVHSLGASFCAIAQSSRASQPTATVASCTDRAAECSIRWTY